MNYQEEILKLYNEIQGLKKWLLENTPTLKELEDINKKFNQQIQALAQKISVLEQKLRLLETKIQK